MIYDLWLGLNIFWEIALNMLPTILLAAFIWLILAGIALSKRSIKWCAVSRIALIPAALVTAVMFVLFPGQSHATLADMGYWVDWTVLSAIALGFGALTFLYAVPALIIFRRTA